MPKKNTISCPTCFSKHLYKYGKNKVGFQKFLCRDCHRQSAPDAVKTSYSPYPKCPVCAAGTYLHHEYAHYSRFKCNSKKCNHTHVVLKRSVFYDPMKKHWNASSPWKRLRTNPNIVLDALYLYFVGASSTRAISQYLFQRKNVAISHVSIYKWIQKFGSAFQELSQQYMPKNLNQSDEWHTDETIIKIHGIRYYLWTLLDSETRFVIDWYLSPSRKASSAFALFGKGRHPLEVRKPLFRTAYQVIRFLRKLSSPRQSIEK